MKKLLFLIGFLILVSVSTQAQVFVHNDSLVYGDSVQTIIVDDLTDIYIDVYNANADSVNVMNIYDYNYLNVLQPVYAISLADDYNWTSVSDISIGATAKASYKLNGSGFHRLRFQLASFEGKTNKFYFTIKGISNIYK